LPEELVPLTTIATVAAGEAALASSRGVDAGAAITVDRVGAPTPLIGQT
jgi:hypothetical protein